MLGSTWIGVALFFVSLPLGGAKVITVILPSPDPEPMLDCDRGPIFVRVSRERAITVNGKTVRQSNPDDT